ncbi:MAG: hypothetical protein HYT46_01870 [Candidatus Vogelbacteria bacterium]|nr:hypothetical protein [Candidatus Vogelbacteria bacterium]
MKYDYSVSFPFDPSRPAFRRPLVEVTLFGPLGSSIKTLALIDSGADYSLFNIEFARKLGLDLSVGERQTTTGIEGGYKELLILDIELQVEALNKIKTPVGFIDSPSVSGLLGQIGFFDLNRVKFERDHNVFEIIPR